MKNNNPFLGTWKLVSWINMDQAGNAAYPYGKEPIGFLIYSEDGYMSAQIMDPDRRQSDADHPIEPSFRQTLPDFDRVMAYNTFMAYCGSYSFSLGKKIMVHHVKMGSIPAWTEQDQLRQFEFRDGKLYLGKDNAQLIWERAGHEV